MENVNTTLGQHVPCTDDATLSTTILPSAHAHDESPQLDGTNSTYTSPLETVASDAPMSEAAPVSIALVSTPHRENSDLHEEVPLDMTLMIKQIDPIKTADGATVNTMKSLHLDLPPAASGPTLDDDHLITPFPHVYESPVATVLMTPPADVAAPRFSRDGVDQPTTSSLGTPTTSIGERRRSDGVENHDTVNKKRRWDDDAAFKEFLASQVRTSFDLSY